MNTLTCQVCGFIWTPKFKIGQRSSTPVSLERLEEIYAELFPKQANAEEEA